MKKVFLSMLFAFFVLSPGTPAYAQTQFDSFCESTRENAEQLQIMLDMCVGYYNDTTYSMKDGLDYGSCDAVYEEMDYLNDLYYTWCHGWD